MQQGKEKNKTALSVFNIHKSFNQVEVLHGIDFNLNIGEIHGLIGQNGAGKSTLVKIINGIYKKDKGSILIRGKEVNYDTPLGAKQNGIAMVFQELSLIHSMKVYENIFLNREPCKGFITDDKAAYKNSIELFSQLGVEINPISMVSELTVSKQQIVEIVKAFSLNPSILIMDEPTAALSSGEIKYLFSILNRLKKENVSVIFVSHHLNEIMEICDRATVIRDGKVALSDNTVNLSLNKIISAMVGNKKIYDYKKSKKYINNNKYDFINNFINNIYLDNYLIYNEDDEINEDDEDFLNYNHYSSFLSKNLNILFYDWNYLKKIGVYWKVIFSYISIIKTNINKEMPLLEVNNISGKIFKDISFNLYPGETLGIVGLMGSGRTELLQTIYGILQIDKGQIKINGKNVKINNPSTAIKLGIFYVTEDRRRYGVIYGQSVYLNILLPMWNKITKGFFILDNKGKQIVNQLVGRLNIVTPHIHHPIEQLSGGNMQKVVFAKGLSSKPRILLLDEPTMGIDVGTKADIAKIIQDTANEGSGVIIVNSEMEEIAKLCDRILVLSKGRIIEEITEAQGKKLTEEILLQEIHKNKG